MKKNNAVIILLSIILAVGAILWFKQFQTENKILKQIIERLKADSRAAEVLVAGVNFDETTRKTLTTIKFLEYDTKGDPLSPRYFTFTGNIIQFQALVIRFEDIQLRFANELKGKSAYLFWKVFMLDGKNTQEFEITPMEEIPLGYKLENIKNSFEKKLWEQFWAYALDPKKAKQENIRNAQIEAPGTIFIPGYLYTIKIEHDGGLRIDSSKLPPILKGEKVL